MLLCGERPKKMLEIGLNLKPIKCLSVDMLEIGAEIEYAILSGLQCSGLFGKVYINVCLTLMSNLKPWCQSPCGKPNSRFYI